MRVRCDEGRVGAASAAWPKSSVASLLRHPSGFRRRACADLGWTGAFGVLRLVLKKPCRIVVASRVKLDTTNRMVICSSHETSIIIKKSVTYSHEACKFYPHRALCSQRRVYIASEKMCAQLSDTRKAAVSQSRNSLQCFSSTRNHTSESLLFFENKMISLINSKECT